MFKQALKRLVLILIPVAFLFAVLILTSLSFQKEELTFKQKNCNPLLGVSFFPEKEKKTDFSLGVSYFLTQSHFLKTLEKLQFLSQKDVFFVLPLVLNKEEDWMISQKTFFILPSGERKEISHVSYEQILSLQKIDSKKKSQTTSDTTNLTLTHILSYLPEDSNFLFHLLGSDREKIIKKLKTTLTSLKGNIYISSTNEKLLNELKTLSFSSSFKILYSFKTLIRMEMLSVFPYNSFKKEGVIIPSSYSFTVLDQMKTLRKNKKLLFLEKDPPYTKQDLKKIEISHVLISSQIQSTLLYLKTKGKLKNKKNCLSL
ncbi:MAG: hypothetical protein GDA46_06570 [Bdellovibrionales bacterium]|nr:hypothetical protein [Bdellovibrionales bacterium]